jgi:hypothetical protein
MLLYRIYVIDPDGKIAGPSKILECPTDDAAIIEAQSCLNGRPIEVWKGANKIAHLDPKQASATH